MPCEHLLPDIARAVRVALSCMAGLLSAAGPLTAAAEPASDAPASLSVTSYAPPTLGAMTLGEITITAERLALLGEVLTASQGVVADHELQLSPAYRPGQLLETVPGLIVTLHSGEGKAGQFLMRGYNLDHGTDLATWVDGMPVNEPSHAHGQGYTDLNFLIPELVDRIGYSKGPYYAAVGDFGAVGSVQLGYRDAMADELTLSSGTLGFQRVLASASAPLGTGRLLAAAELQHYDGPFSTPDDARKENAVLRYSHGDDQLGYSLTAMYYHQRWTSTTDIPLRAIDQGLVADRFGSLDPSDGGRAQRASLSLQYHQTLAAGQFSASSYFIDNQLHMYSDFTHFLIDPIHGDQEEQFENRHTAGGTAEFTLPVRLGRIDNQLSVGVAVRADALDVGRLPSQARAPQAPQADPASFSDSDQVSLFSSALYAQASTRWTPRLRSVVGARVDYQRGSDIDYLARRRTRAPVSAMPARQASVLGQPKASVIFSPRAEVEFYLSAGQGFHSADIRGVNQDKSAGLGLPGTPLLAKQDGQEVGLRAQLQSNLAFTLALYNLWQQSETIIDPDIGQDTAGPPQPALRLRAQYHLPDSSLAGALCQLSRPGNHTRFTRDFDDGTGHEGRYITDAPHATGSLALYLTHLGRWSAGLDYRYLGS